ncbi:MAG: hypothetical protein AAGB51_08910 [Planctomycetota bacterium]
MHRFLLFVMIIFSGCASSFSQRLGPASIEIIRTETHHGTQPGISLAGQGVCIFDGKVYLYGDANPGLIREFDFVNERLVPTGREVRLTRDGEDVLPHPTGLTVHPRLGCFIGDTVRQKGVIWHIDWYRAWADGTLDNAILNQTIDDIAVNGTRPEWVRYQGRWLIATSDYGNDSNSLRLYDPSRLANVSRTSMEGVLIHRWPCGSFVQRLHWIDDAEQLVLVQNQRPGLLYRVTCVELRPELETLTGFEPIDLDRPTDELEGFGLLDDGYAVMLSAYPEDNTHIVRLID